MQSRFLSALSVCMLASLIPPSVALAQSTATKLTVRHELNRDVSPALADMIRSGPSPARLSEEADNMRHFPLPIGLRAMSMQLEDPVLQTEALATSAPAAIKNFEGIGDGAYGFTPTALPPDPNGSVGATQYVQWVNFSFAVFDKSTGKLLAGPTAGNTLWKGFGGNCEVNNDGDPIILYDKLANRWIFTQFSVTGTPFLQCVAISTTSDATGPYFRYSFQYTDFDDYPKMGVWPDAYYVTFNMFDSTQATLLGADVCAYDRAAMLNGQPSTQICFQQHASIFGLLPSDVDGVTPPPAGSPNYLMNYGTNALELYKFHVDFSKPSNSTFTGPTTIPVAPFTPLCDGSTCVPQPNSIRLLDSLADRLMYRLAYRNFKTHESLVVNHAVAVRSGNSGGIRWYEIQNPSGTPQVVQQGTYSPDANYRWMGSIAMDKAEDIALGYSISSSTVKPSIAYTGRTPSDPPGTMEAETRVITGTGVQNGFPRWGDYSSMSVDPVDDCTFWYTQEYRKTTGSRNWNTRIVSFKFPNCSGAPTPTPTPSATPTPTPTLTSYEAEAAGNTLAGTTKVSNCAACSGGKDVRIIGNGAANFVTVNHVSAVRTGSYTLTIYCLVNGTRTFSVSVNGAAAKTVSCTGSSWTVPVSHPPSITVNLNAGPGNTIKLFNSTAFAPDLDRITVK